MSKLLLPPEGYSLWALIPAPLLSHKIIMDEGQYQKAQDEKDASTYDYLVARALPLT